MNKVTFIAAVRIWNRALTKIEVEVLSDKDINYFPPEGSKKTIQIGKNFYFPKTERFRIEDPNGMVIEYNRNEAFYKRLLKIIHKCYNKIFKQ